MMRERPRLGKRQQKKERAIGRATAHLMFQVVLRNATGKRVHCGKGEKFFFEKTKKARGRVATAL